MQTIQEHISDRVRQFQALSRSRQRQLRLQAVEYVGKNPGSADASTYWRGLSARQVIAAANTR